MNDITKMQGLGNSFVVFRGPLSFSKDEIVSLCDDNNHCDGVLVVSTVDDRTVRMQYWNSDGSMAEMCGNGLRCVVRFAVDNHMIQPGSFKVATDAGTLQVVWDGRDENHIEVQVGKVEIGKELTLQGHQFIAASVGNPHAVTFVTNVQSAPVQLLGPIIETDPNFPNKTNVEFVQIINDHEISIRTWERGSGETLACGTGMAAAAAVAADKIGTTYPMTVNVLGGQARLWIDDDGYTRMDGPALVVN